MSAFAALKTKRSRAIEDLPATNGRVAADGSRLLQPRDESNDPPPLPKKQRRKVRTELSNHPEPRSQVVAEVACSTKDFFGISRNHTGEPSHISPVVADSEIVQVEDHAEDDLASGAQGGDSESEFGLEQDE